MVSQEDSDSEAIGLFSMFGHDSVTGDNDWPESAVTSSTGNDCMAIVPVCPPSHTSDGKPAIQSEYSITEATGFAGLINSGMTCYMNSLLQTLYMTPEFRNAIYAWRFEGTAAEAVTSIPYQLQRLFVQLYATKSAAVSTNGVTTSFGWRSTDMIQQHDVHELCRVMFDALEKKFAASQGKGSPVQTTAAGDRPVHAPTQDLINRLYQGERSDCVRCTACNRVSCRPDTFLDIQVPLRPFGLDVKPYESLEAAFRGMMEPERLDGSNQYYCSRCQTKRDAERVCAFHRMPYLLTLQLMRFTFDMTTLNRIKINDCFTFPLDRWDLSELITPPPVNSEDGDELSSATEEDYEDEDYEDSVPESSRLTGQTTDDGYEEMMDVANGDSGLNSTATDSSSNLGSPNVEVDDGLSEGNHVEYPTITAAFPTGSALEKAMASAVAKRSDLHVKASSCNGLRSDQTVDTDEDDGFGTGDARSACSSSTNNSSVRPDEARGRSTRPRNQHGSNLKRRLRRSSMNTELTPTKDRHSLRSSDPYAEEKRPSTVYELFSIMVHSGFINGGHYYAYIRSFTDGQWYCFNDNRVTRATQADLEETFGSSKLSSYASNAYFLMYRRVDPSMNEQFMRPEEFPEHIRQMMDEIRAEEAEVERKRELEQSIFKFDAFTRSPTDHTILHKTVELMKNQTLSEAACAVREALLPDWPNLSAPACRLIQYTDVCLGKSAEYTLQQRSTSSVLTTINGDQNATQSLSVQDSIAPDANDLVTVGEFANQKRFYPFKLWLEHRVNVPGALSDSISTPVWRPYQPKGVTFRITRVDVSHNYLYAEEKLWFPATASIHTVCCEIWQLYTGSAVVPTSSLSTFHLLTDAGCRPPQPAKPHGLPQWVFVLSDPSFQQHRVEDLFADNLADLQYSYSYRKCDPPQIYVDLGRAFDGQPTLNATDETAQQNGSAKRGRWQSGPTETTSTSPICRLRQFAAVIDEHLYFEQFTVELPPQEELDAIVLQRHMMCSNESVGMELDQSYSEPGHSSERNNEVTAFAPSPVEPEGSPSSANSWSSWIGKTKDCLTNALSGPLTHLSHSSSTDSGCSVAANPGSPLSTRRRSSSPFDSFSSSSPLRRRSNSQSNLDQIRANQDSLAQHPSLSSSSLNIRRRPKLPNTVIPSNSSPGPLPTMTLSQGNEDLIFDCCSACNNFKQAQEHRFCSFFEPLNSNSSPGTGRCLCVRLDKRLSVDQFRANLADYLDLDQHSVKINVSVQQCGLRHDFQQVQSSDKLVVSLCPNLEPGVIKVALRVLDLSFIRANPTNQSPVWSTQLPLFCRQDWCIGRVLSSVSSLLESVYCIHMPQSGLRLRKCGLTDSIPGPVISHTDVLSQVLNPHQALMVQLVPEQRQQQSTYYPDHSNATGFIFARHWHPSSLRFGDTWSEVWIPPGVDRWRSIIDQICAQSGIPEDRLSVAVCNFPGVPMINWSGVSPLAMSTLGLLWQSCRNYNSLVSTAPTNGQVVYYKDENEVVQSNGGHQTDSDYSSTCLDSGCPSGDLNANSVGNIPSLIDDSPVYGPHLPSASSTTSFPLHNYRSRYEQPLRIYTVEDISPSTSSGQTAESGSSTRSGVAKPRESRTP